jgi:hypothetical protein
MYNIALLLNLQGSLMYLSKLKAYLLFSIVPVTQLVGLVPLLSTTYGLSLEQTGWIFFFLRIALLAGSFSVRYLSILTHAFNILIISEFVSSLLSLLCVYFLMTKNLVGISLFFILRCLIVGISNNARMTLLKTLEDQLMASRAAVFASTIVQASYVISGILFIFSTLNADLFLYAILVNVFTPLIAVPLLNRTPFQNTQYSDQVPLERRLVLDLGFLFEKSKRNLFLVSIIVGLTFGGIDILCLNYGKEIYKGDYGYGIITILYSAGFYIGYQVYDSFKTGFMKGLKISILALLLIFMSSHTVKNLFLDTFLLLLIFIIYGFLFAIIEREWYLNIDPKKSSSQFFAKDLIIALTYASGEIIYSQLHEIDRGLRISFLLVLLTLVLFKKTSQKRGSI